MVFYFSTFSLLGQENPSCGAGALSLQERRALYETIGFDIENQERPSQRFTDNVIEREIPIHVFIINDHEGNPPFVYSLDRFGFNLSLANSFFKELPTADETIDENWNFFICQVTEIQDDENGFLYNPTSGSRNLLLEDYGDENAMNVFLVHSMERDGIANLLNHPSNKQGVYFTRIGADSYFTIGHEFGHSFGLDHTFGSPGASYNELDFNENNYGYLILRDDNTIEYFSNNDLWTEIAVPDCALDPGNFGPCTFENTGDMIQDTDVDPIQYFDYHEDLPECSASSENCIIELIYGNGSYEFFPPYYNIMSYYTYAENSHFSQLQKEVMYLTLTTHPNRIYLIDEDEPECNEVVIENPYYSKTGRVEYIVGDAVGCYDFKPMANIRIPLINITNDVTCSKDTNIEGKYSTSINRCGSSNPLNPGGVFADIDMEFGHYEDQNLEYLNGVSTLDLILMSKHILGVKPLNSPYKVIAADVNNSGTISTLDIIRLRKFILGIDSPGESEAPSWRFLPKYTLDEQWGFESTFINNPFDAIWGFGANDNRAYLSSPGNKSYLDKVNLNLLNPDAGLEDNWSFIGIKTGDLNGNANVLELGLQPDIDVFTLDVPSHDEVLSGEQFSIQCDIEGDFDIEGYQMALHFDPNQFKITGFSQGDVPDFTLDNFNVDDVNGVVKILWYLQGGSTPPALNGSTTAFNIHGEVTGGAIQDIAEAIRFDTTSINNEFYDDALVRQKGVVLKLSVTKKGKKHILKSVFPNPTSSNIGVEFQLKSDKDVEFILMDNAGNTLTHTQFYSAGLHTYYFNDTSTLMEGMISYQVLLGNEINTGYLIKL